MRSFPEDLPDIASVAAALGDQSRAAMCAAMMDGRAWTAGELATYCHLTRPTATKHIDRLVRSRIVTDVRQGKHRYVRLSSDDVAAVIEQLGILATAQLPTPGSLRACRTREKIRAGRTCYKHLAGQLGVGLTEQMRRRGLLSPEWRITPDGAAVLATWGIPQATAIPARPCMDSTERRFHLAGRAGQDICAALQENGWVERIGTTRAVRLTESGRTQLAECGLTPLLAAEPHGRAG